MTRLFDSDRWSEIWQTISRNRKRSIMTALGVFWGIFMLTVMLGAGMGLERLFRAQLGDMSTNTVLMQPQQTSVPYKGMPKNRWWRMVNSDVEVLKQLPEVLYASAAFWGGELHCSRSDRKGDYSLMGYSPDYQRINPQKILYGRFINDVDMQRKRKVCVIGTQVWKDLFPGGEDPAGRIIKVNNSYFTVIGVIRKQSSAMSFSDVERTIIVPVSLAQQMFGRGDFVHMIAVAGRDDIASERVEKACKEILFARHLIAPDDEKAVWTIAVAEMLGRVQGLFRGIALLNMIAYHAAWDLVYIYGTDWGWYRSEGAYVWQQGICWTFIFLSGFCWSLGSHVWKRGITVFLGGAVITLVTLLVMPQNRVVFGVLTLIGSCMLLMNVLDRWLRRVRPGVGMAVCGLLFFSDKEYQ